VLQSATAATALSSGALWVGIGCKRGTSAGLIHYAFDTVCRNYTLDRTTIAGVATLQGKQEEAGLIEFCHAQRWSKALPNLKIALDLILLRGQKQPWGRPALPKPQHYCWQCKMAGFRN
jgi:Cobalamin synthesis G C-terminus